MGVPQTPLFLLFGMEVRDLATLVSQDMVGRKERVRRGLAGGERTEYLRSQKGDTIEERVRMRDDDYGVGYERLAFCRSISAGGFRSQIQPTLSGRL